jgi:hypothetical protein
MSARMLNYTATDNSNQIMDILDHQSSMAISVDAKAPESAPIECDPFMKYDHRVLQTSTFTYLSCRMFPSQL